MKKNNSITIEKIVKELCLTYQYHREDYKTSLKFARMLISKDDEAEFDKTLVETFDKAGLYKQA